MTSYRDGNASRHSFICGAMNWDRQALTETLVFSVDMTSQNEYVFPFQ